MAIGPIRHGNRARLVTAKKGDRLLQVPGMLADLTVGPPEIFAPGCPEDHPRGLGLREPLLDRAVAAHLAGGQITQPDAKTTRRMLSNRPPEPDFQVIGMRSEHEDIDSHQRVNSNA
jgi:hypothetical protein